jgi:competence protein ComEC
MAISFGAALCCAYVVGLLLSQIAGSAHIRDLAIPWAGILGGLLIFAGGAIASQRFNQRLWLRQCCCLAVVFCLATVYAAVRSPATGAEDVSRYVERAQAIAPTQVITGRLLDEPSLNRDLKGRFRIAVQQLQVLNASNEITFQIPVTGSVYVTAPLLQVTGLHNHQLIKAKGKLYLPQGAMNPNAFDFRAYLTQGRTFTGFVAEELRFHKGELWGLWRLRQRIVRTQLRALGSPLGQLVSAMALGRKAVDLPTDIQDLFSRVGLAHTIAASGFHVSLLLGTVLALLRSRADHTKVAIGGIVLIGYVTLTGLQASVVRAAIMGTAALIGIATHRKIMPSGALLVAVTGMLLFNPNWIWDIGFQLSVVATWGLIATVPAITQRLDWLPVTLAGLMAVPLAATLWTLPLMLYHFNVISGLSIGLNIVATPLVSLISLGGIGSSALALIFPFLGELAAKLLYLPVHVLLWLAQTSSELPGSSIAIGQIGLWQLLGLYFILIVSCLQLPRGRILSDSLLAIVFLALVVGPMGWRLVTQNQITVLAAGDELIWVMQEHGRVSLVNSGNEKTAFYTVAPFLKQAGVNRIEQAIALPFGPDYVSGWRTLLRQTPTKHIYSISDISKLSDWAREFHRLPSGQLSNLKALDVQLLGIENPILRLTAQQSWLLLPSLPLDLQEYLSNAGAGLASEVLVYAGGEISPALLNVVKPKTVICYGSTLPEAVERRLQQSGIRVFWTNRDGAVIWQQKRGFHSYLETKHRNALPWG